MSFVAGNRVRFGATFRDADGRAFDPVAVVVTITVAGGRQRQLSLKDGGVRRRGVGQFYVDVLLEDSGVVDVKFASVGAGQEGWQRDQYLVAADAPDLGRFDAEQIEPEPFDEQPFDQIDVDDEDGEDWDGHVESEREQMAAELEAAGMRIDASCSDAYIEAAHRAMQPRGESPRQSYLRRQRSG